VSVQESTTTLEDATDDWCGKTGGERVMANGKHIALVVHIKIRSRIARFSAVTVTCQASVIELRFIIRSITYRALQCFMLFTNVTNASCTSLNIPLQCRKKYCFDRGDKLLIGEG